VGGEKLVGRIGHTISSIKVLLILFFNQLYRTSSTYLEETLVGNSTL
jgi:hypothetical protein